MKRSTKKLSVIELAAVGFMVFSSIQPVSAGNTTSVSSTTAAGWVYSDLVYGSKVAAQRGSTTGSITKPASAVNYRATNTYAPTGNSPIASNLPPGAITAGATTFFSQATTVFLTGGWKGQARTKVAYPATAENPALQAELLARGFVLPGAKCGAEYDIASGGELDSSGKKVLVVYGTATEGTAAWFQGFAGGKKLYDVLITGPFNFGSETNDCKALRVPFVYDGDIDDVTFLADTVAITDTTLAIIGCPTSLDLECGQPLNYDGISVSGGCENVDVTYNPPLGTVLPLGTVTVTVTATDEAYNQTNCTFEVTVVDTTAPPVPVLATVTGECSATVTAPTVKDNCGATITGTTSAPLTYNSQGTYTILWTFDDGNGNTSTANQTVIVKDTTPPPAPTLATVTGECSATVTAPTVKDNCGATITGTTSAPLTYNSQGTYTILWTFNDGNGNTSKANQTVIVKDTVPPVKPTLEDVNVGQCSGTPPTPTTTDLCAGTVTGTTAKTFPITTQGTTVVIWTFNDGNGNSTTANQNVIVKDITPPAFTPSSLETKTGDCSSGPMSLTTPKVTDNCSDTITVVANPAGPYSRSTTVTWTATDAAGNSSQATQQVVINGYTFRGFDAPIGGVGGACNAPIPTSTANAGSSVQIKFGVLDCNGATATGIVPHVRIYSESATCTETLISEGDAEVVNGQWHFQWNTRKADKGKTFRIGVSLETSSSIPIPGTENFGNVFIKLK